MKQFKQSSKFALKFFKTYFPEHSPSMIPPFQMAALLAVSSYCACVPAALHTWNVFILSPHPLLLKPYCIFPNPDQVAPLLASLSWTLTAFVHFYFVEFYWRPT